MKRTLQSDTVQKHAEVAVLLSTYNGARFIEPQIRSLTQNDTPFTLHWLDDHSTDNSCEVVRAAVAATGVRLIEWHHPQHQGYPGAFFQLLECVNADVYLFCDQDDIWQPGKIDATVANLLSDIAAPVLCFSQALMFRNDAPEVLHQVYAAMGANVDGILQESRLFVFNPAQGNTIGFTRPLREIFLRHKEIARAYAAGHDWWMYVIAVASGTSRMLSNVPTTLYRMHGNNLGAVFFNWSQWRLQQGIRRWAARQAAGFCLASSTLEPGPRLERLRTLARLVATLDRRQSPFSLVRLLLCGAIPPSGVSAAWLAAACLCSDAKVDSHSIDPISYSADPTSLDPTAPRH